MTTDALAPSDDPEADFDPNREYPKAAELHIDASDVVSLAEAIEAGVPIQALTEAHVKAQLTTHTWTPGAACPMRSVNRKVGAMVSLYDLRHKDSTIVVPEGIAGAAWLARCETHESDFYSATQAPAWEARNKPWTFCTECAAIYGLKHGGAVTAKGKKTKTVAVAPKPEPKPKKPRAKKPKVEKVEDASPAPQDDYVVVVPDPNDPEEAVWNEWAGRLQTQAPAGSTIDWVTDYHYQVNLPDGRSIDLMVHKDIATFRHRDENGHDHYADDLPTLLGDIG